MTAQLVFQTVSNSERTATCECCGHLHREWKESMTKGLARALAKLHKCVAMKGVNDVYTGDINNTEPVKFTHSERCNWTKLKFHGLIFQHVDGKTRKPIQARYGLTQRGYDFLMNRKKIHKYVWSYNGKISDAPDARSLEMVDLEDVIKMSVNFQTIEEFESRPHDISQQSLI